MSAAPRVEVTSTNSAVIVVTTTEPTATNIITTDAIAEKIKAVQS